MKTRHTLALSVFLCQLVACSINFLEPTANPNNPFYNKYARFVVDAGNLYVSRIDTLFQVQPSGASFSLATYYVAPGRIVSYDIRGGHVSLVACTRENTLSPFEPGAEYRLVLLSQTGTGVDEIYNQVISGDDFDVFLDSNMAYVNVTITHLNWGMDETSLRTFNIAQLAFEDIFSFERLCDAYYFSANYTAITYYGGGVVIAKKYNDTLWAMGRTDTAGKVAECVLLDTILFVSKRDYIEKYVLSRYDTVSPQLYYVDRMPVFTPDAIIPTPHYALRLQENNGHWLVSYFSDSTFTYSICGLIDSVLAVEKSGQFQALHGSNYGGIKEVKLFNDQLFLLSDSTVALMDP